MTFARAVWPLVLAALASWKNTTSGPRTNDALPPRTFRMGFSANPPQPTNESALAIINAWTPHADAAIMHVSVPYKALLAGTTAATYVNTIDLRSRISIGREGFR